MIYEPYVENWSNNKLNELNKWAFGTINRYKSPIKWIDIEGAQAYYASHTNSHFTVATITTKKENA